MAIACVYCGGAHPTAGEVRQCWERSQHDGQHRSVEHLEQGEARPVQAARVTGVGIAGAAYRLGRGPHLLGRNVVVALGSEPPSDWDGCERIRIDSGAVGEPLPAVERLRAAAFERRGVVIELIDDTAPPAVERRPAHELGPRFAFDGDELHHLVWSNSVDGRDPHELKWWLVDRAVALGAAFGGAADVVLPDGTAVWLDGGPARFTDPVDGCPVLHGVAVEHGSLAPPCPTHRAPIDMSADLAPTSSRPSCTPAARPGSSPRPAPARPACSPSGPATCSTAGGCRRAP